LLKGRQFIGREHYQNLYLSCITFGYAEKNNAIGFNIWTHAAHKNHLVEQVECSRPGLLLTFQGIYEDDTCNAVAPSLNRISTFSHYRQIPTRMLIETRLWPFSERRLIAKN